MSEPDRPTEQPRIDEPQTQPGGSRPMRVHHVPTVVDKAIEQATREGAFDNLPGAGKPLRLESSDDPEWWVKGFIQREGLDFSEALPGPLQLRRERAGFPDSLLHLIDEDQVRDHLEDFNARVVADRRRPVAGATSPPVVGRVDVDEVVAAWRAAAEERRLAEPQFTGAADGGGDDAGSARPATPRPRRWWAPWGR